MPFSLKNAEATYQRLMDKVFQEHIDRNVEVYVDNMVAKIVSLGDHCMDLEEIFVQLRKSNMRLNPIKCAFGVEVGKFLGFIITRRGIEANPDKYQTIQEMKSPNTVKEVQSLAGKITALSQFMSKAANKTAPLFNFIRKAKNFQWTPKCEEDF